jgi:hypothetical protein
MSAAYDLTDDSGRRTEGSDICSVTIIFILKEAPEIRLATAATSEVGGEYPEIIAMKNKKKCATHGLIPMRIIGGITIAAAMMQQADGGIPRPGKTPIRKPTPMKVKKITVLIT